jgi:predicted TIM-barrel fold metal-dependent hydrolase
MAELKLPLNLHICTLEQTEKIAKDFPGMNIIIAHPTFEVQERLSLVKRYRNLYLDLSGCAVGRFRLARTAIDTTGRDKLLFGTDFPVCHPAASIAAVLADINSQEEFDALMSMNFRKLTGL